MQTSDTTLIEKTMSVSVGDLKVGERVMVSGSKNDDGSYTARSIQSRARGCSPPGPVSHKGGRSMQRLKSRAEVGVGPDPGRRLGFCGDKIAARQEQRDPGEQLHPGGYGSKGQPHGVRFPHWPGFSGEAGGADRGRDQAPLDRAQRDGRAGSEEG